MNPATAFPISLHTCPSVPESARKGIGGSGRTRNTGRNHPTSLSLDFAHGGFGAAWIEPELHLARWLSVRSTVEEIGYRPATGWTSAAGALVVVRAAGLSGGVGPRAWIDWCGGSGSAWRVDSPCSRIGSPSERGCGIPRVARAAGSVS